MDLHLTVLGEPVAKARPRVARRGSRVWLYTPDKTAHHENRIKDEAAKQGVNFDESPVEVRLLFTKSKPKSASKKALLPAKRPDLDSYCRLVLDALQGIVFKDDSQVVVLVAGKQYGDNPRTEITVREARPLPLSEFGLGEEPLNV